MLQRAASDYQMLISSGLFISNNSKLQLGAPAQTLQQHSIQGRMLDL